MRESGRESRKVSPWVPKRAPQVVLKLPVAVLLAFLGSPVFPSFSKEKGFRSWKGWARLGTGTQDEVLDQFWVRVWTKNFDLGKGFGAKGCEVEKNPIFVLGVGCMCLYNACKNFHVKFSRTNCFDFM